MANQQMPTELLNAIKLKYKTHLHSEKGKQQLKEAIEIKREWKKMVGDITINTAGVKTSLINKDLAKNIQKIEIIPIGLNNMCHLTSELLCSTGDGITHRIGFNITACPCGRKMGYELHSVNKHNGILYDFTRDFNDEPYKYFLEMDTDIPIRSYIQCFGAMPFSINKGCKCPIEWLNSGMNKSEKDIIEHIKNVERMKMI
jgi:hypothetical protein